jgi:hypothetical protein
MRVVDYPYRKGDEFIVVQFLDDFILFGTIGELSGEISFEKDELYKLPTDIALEINEQGLCVYCEKISIPTYEELCSLTSLPSDTSTPSNTSLPSIPNKNSFFPQEMEGSEGSEGRNGVSDLQISANDKKILEDFEE